MLCRYEQAFLTLLLEHLHKDVWIGLRRGSWSFYWVDSTPLEYTNWDIGHPRLTRPHNRCVFMTYFRDAGRWKNTACSTQLGFICEEGGFCGALTNLTVILTDAVELRTGHQLKKNKDAELLGKKCFILFT